MFSGIGISDSDDLHAARLWKADYLKNFHCDSWNINRYDVSEWGVSFFLL